MVARPRIGVTGNARRWSPSWWCIRLAVLLAGGRPVRISVRHTPSRPVDGIIIGGGDDISPELYEGEDMASSRTDPERDRLEVSWIRVALDAGLPVLGICRGAQLLNVVLGGTLLQDIRPLRRRTSNRPGLLPTKYVRVRKDSRLQEVCKRRSLRVNSLHSQAVKEPGAGLRVVARDLDRFVQAVEWSGSGRLLGVQWHPEYLMYLPSQFALFQWLVQNARAMDENGEWEGAAMHRF